MWRILICWAGLLLIATGVVAQTAPPDSQLTQAVLSEVRQLRQDLQSTAAIIQRVQIVVYRIQAQEGQLVRAMQRLETARNICKRERDAAQTLHHSNRAGGSSEAERTETHPIGKPRSRRPSR